MHEELVPEVLELVTQERIVTLSEVTPGFSLREHALEEIRLDKSLAHHHINVRSRDSYRAACEYLNKVKEAYVFLQRMSGPLYGYRRAR